MRNHQSEISGAYLGPEPLSWMFHHILPKSKYPEHRLNAHNIIMLTFEEHQKVEQDPNYFPLINVYREKLLKQK